MSLKAENIKPIEIFYSYASTEDGLDEQLQQQLEKHLGVLRRRGIISNWHKRNISPGYVVSEEVIKHLNTAQIILLLISPDFVNSDDCWDIEMSRALIRQKEEKTLVIPVLLRPVEYKEAPFYSLRVLPKNGKPVTLWSNQDEAFTDIAQNIRLLVKNFERTQKISWKNLGSGVTMAIAISTLLASSSPDQHQSPLQRKPYAETKQSQTPTPLPVRTSPLTYYGHVGPVVELAWSPDGKRIASASFDTTIQIWNVADGSHVYTCQGHTAILKAVAWSPRGNRIASGSQDFTARLWDTATGKQVYVYNDGNYVNGIAWSPDGQLLAHGSGDGTVRVWNATYGANVYIYHRHSGYLGKVRWSSNGKRIVSTGGDGTVQVWNATDGGNVYIYRGQSPQTTGVAWSPDGKYIASGSSDTTVQVWNATNGNHIYTYRGHTAEVSMVTWSPDGKYIASGSNDGTVQIWSITGRGNTHIYYGHGSTSVYTVKWSPDGKYIASGGIDATVQVWQAPIRSRRSFLTHF